MPLVRPKPCMFTSRSLRAMRNTDRPLEEVDDEQVQQRGHTEGEREPSHRADGGQVEHRGRDARHDVGRHDRAERPLERGLHGRSGALAASAPRPSAARRTRCRSRPSHRGRSPGRPRPPASWSSRTAVPAMAIRAMRQDRPDRHPGDRDDAEEAVVEEHVREEQEQAQGARPRCPGAATRCPGWG